MRKKTPGAGPESTPTWETLEAFVRQKVQDVIQSVLEEEVTSHLGRQPSERRTAVDAAPGYRNGYGKRRRLALSCGTIEVRRPRVRNLDARFESRVLPLFRRYTQEVGALLPELYLHGLARGDFELALRCNLPDYSDALHHEELREGTEGGLQKSVKEEFPGTRCAA
jgi:transposase-like protein